MYEQMRPPVNRAMRTLDRSFFHKTVHLSAARVFRNQDIASCRSALSRAGDILKEDRISPVFPDPDPQLAQLGRRVILLQPDILHNDSFTWSPSLRNMVQQDKSINLVPYELPLDYHFWNYDDIMQAIMPENLLEEIPSGFQVVGHVAHLNLRDQYLPYKHLIASVILDKTPVIRTVINKIDTVGHESQYRTFQYELLAGEHDMNVEVKEQGCIFRFNYATVYWNSRLNTEHERLVHLFQSGTAICDVMAGIGPFAVPAAKNNCFVWANDLNPESFAALQTAIKVNKVGQFVKPFNQDGSNFILHATTSLFNDDHRAVIKKKQSKSSLPATQNQDFILESPKTFSHFVMNLPASAMDFLPSFIGLYSKAGIPSGSQLPFIHVYCFGPKSADNNEAFDAILRLTSQQLGFDFTLGRYNAPGQLEVFDVRDVAPKKRMFCVSFQLPADVAYRTA